MNNDSLVLKTQACSLTEDNESCDTTRSRRSLPLPSELRQQVYRELLLPSTSRKVHTNILRVNRKTHDEAIKILYEENGAVLIHTHYDITDNLSPRPYGCMGAFPFNFDVARVYKKRTGHEYLGYPPVLTITITPIIWSGRPNPPREKFQSYAGFCSDTLPKLCRLLTNCYVQDRLFVSVSLPSVEVLAWEGCRENLLDCFEECRGVGNAAIRDTEGSIVATDLASQMIKPFQHFDEILARAHGYLDRIRQQISNKHDLQAHSCLARATDFFDWWSEADSLLINDENRENITLVGETTEKWDEYKDMQLEISWLSISHALRVGKSEDCRAKINQLFRKRLPITEVRRIKQRVWEGESDGHYMLGLSYLLEGAKNSALYYFLQALISKPGHEGADKEIDRMEAAVEYSDYPLDEIVRWNIKHVLGNFRHQPLLEPSLDGEISRHRGPANMTEDDLMKLAGRFVGSIYGAQTLIRSGLPHM